ncbi:MAG: LysM peptidoglycan-binding domain-containing protein [Candidatus Hydrogenedentes bacterium]|nr:LysM peptidoglycan-binding domain-containing protein [Candidatus Hydrogenedentota bacterium]
MRKHLSWAAYGAAAFGLTLAFGCSTTPTEQTHQFTPVPVARVGEQELEPAVAARPATDLLKAADEAFRKANEAQERGDQKEALRHYNTMLQLMIEADLDPAVFYGLRTEFERILDSSSETADLFERSGAGEFNDDNLNQRATGGELFSKGFINERVIKEIEEIQKLYPKNFQGGLDRSYKYRPYIEQELEKAGLPKDLVWLAMVESQFHPSVTSRAGAVGMWQFMRATGTRYGLRVDNYVDERRDWQKATHAAIRYLTDLNTMFGGDWPLAISSYNMGEGGISRSIAMNGGERDLWKLMETPPASNHMKEETKKFYPKLLASVLVGKNPERYGFKRNPSPMEEILRVPVRGSYSLAMLDKEAGLPSGTLKRLNPDLVKGVTPASGEHSLAVPAEANSRMLAALDTLYKQPKRATYASSGSGTHIVRRGETPSGIARKYGISSKELMDANRIRSASKLSVGRKLVIPGRGEDQIPQVEEPAEREAVKGTSQESIVEAAAPSQPAEPKTYRVKRGDTLFEIARAYDVSLSDLQAWNKLDRHARIHVGESLIVGSSQTSPNVAEGPKGEKQVHRVKPGEFPSKIAQNYGVTLDQLLAWNNLTKKSIIRAGDELVLYPPAGSAPAERVEVAKSTAPERVQPEAPAPEQAPAPAAETTKKTHTVSSGETASTIAAKYGMSTNDFLRMNNLTKSSVLQIGQKCAIGEGSAPAAATASPQAEASATHTVDKGESAWTIAAKYGMDVDALLAMNRLSKDSVLKAGQELKVSGEAAASNAPSEASVAPTVHKVAKGETASAIAQKYGMSTKTLLALNGLSKNDVLQVGQELKVSGKADASASKAEKASKTIVHKTSAGQSPSSIAKKYGVSTGDLFKWNNWSKNHILKIGEEVTIHVP